MKPRAFFDAVTAMRQAQETYRHNPTQETRNAKLAAEKTVDDEINRVLNIIKQKQDISQQNQPPISADPSKRHQHCLTGYEMCQYHCTARNCDYILSRSCDMCQIVYSNLKKQGIPVSQDIIQIFEPQNK